jgi:class 3 adenylate cyclase
MDGALSLDRHGLLGRFDAPVEQDYQRWMAQRLRMLAAAMGLVSIATWVVTPPLMHALLDLDHPALAYLIGWGVNIPMIAAGTAYVRRPEPRHAVAVGASLVAVTAVDTIVGLMPMVPDLDPTAYALAATFYGLIAPVTQLPFRTTSVIAVMVTAAGEAGAFLTADQNDAGLALAAIWIPLSTLLVGPAMAIANERGLRERFVDERTIEQQRKLIRRYAPSSVVSRIELGDTTVDSPQRRKITVFSSDVVGFTAMADRVDPEALAHIINDYLGSVSDLVERHGGTVTEFAGDGVMAIFGAPDDLDPSEQVASAIAAARELQASLPEWSRTWYQHGIVEDTKARIGINTGVVSVGTFGSAIRATYTGIGLQMNIAARVQAQAEPGGILLSNTSWHLVKDDVPCEPRGEVMVKGVHFPIHLYAPVG